MVQSLNRAQLGESLSALADDEASEFELRRVLEESGSDPQVRERWHRYQLVRAALRGGSVGSGDSSLADRVRESIADIEIDSGSGRGPARRGADWRRWRANAGRVAIAVSVAGAVMLGARQVGPVGPGGAGGTDIASEAPESGESSTDTRNVPVINVQNVSGGEPAARQSRSPGTPYAPDAQQQQLEDEAVRRYIRQLMLEHAEHSAQNSGSGLMPYVRVPAENEN